ncbi:hypothetical protein [Amantichitinum ursilacus]|uniref:Transferrin binding protein-like solute binding protein n=1 Tax=Amantichitinum ursilacus TaxID=857265 RepID=A0A0N0GQY4_9NEIS|nr:hypothetical protein [Amantichitinum ursilacus]KPC55158.1 hypothetical protein WG78_00825 [Amantichitinum ursilacus]
MTQFARMLKLSLIAAAVAALSACGGDGGSDASTGSVSNPTPTPTAVPTPTPAPTPTATAFVAGAKPGYFLIWGGSVSIGKLDTVQQDSAGAIRSVSSFTTTADSTVGDVLSTAHVATGEWQSGSTSYVSGGNTDGPYDNKSYGYSYVVYNNVQAYAGDATLTCTPHFTTPMNAGKFASITGTATLSINGGVANAAVNMTLTATDKSQTNISNSATLAPGMNNMGTLLAGGSRTSAALLLGEGEAGGYTLIAPWAASTTAGGKYTGIAVFNCK